MGKMILACTASLFLAACSTTPPEGKTPAEVLFKEAKKLMEDKRYIMAIEKLNLLRSQYPYSFYATHAELLLADIYFLQENYIEAAAAYILFRDFHPRDKRMPSIVFKIAESFLSEFQAPTTETSLRPSVLLSITKNWPSAIPTLSTNSRHGKKLYAPKKC